MGRDSSCLEKIPRRDSRTRGRTAAQDMEFSKQKLFKTSLSSRVVNWERRKIKIEGKMREEGENEEAKRENEGEKGESSTLGIE